MAKTSSASGHLSPPPPQSFDHRSGFCRETKTFRSLRPTVPLPPPAKLLSFASYAFSLLPSPLPPNPAFVDAATGASISYPRFLSLVRNLASSLRSHLGLSNGHVAFVLSPASLDVPVLYFALLSLGVVVSPANPACTAAEISHLFRTSNPSIAFATSSTASKLPRHVTAVLLDTPEFFSLLTAAPADAAAISEVRQSDTAAIQYSSGTTGRVKAAALSHRSLIAVLAGFQGSRSVDVTLLVAPMFHSMGFFFMLKGVALGQTVVVVDRSGFPELLRAAERHRTTQILAAPPVVVAMARSEEALCFDLGALEQVVCGGAPVSVEVAERFRTRFPSVNLCMGYGSTEAGGISRMIGPGECHHIGSVGRLSQNVEAKIVDNVSGETLSIYQQGELWLRGPAIMTGYVGDQEANASTFDSDGWMKTGDLCYFDHDGFLFIVDRLKELIKYKGYQVPPAELEHLLQTLPGVIDAAVIPYPNEEVGEIPMAFVVRQPGSKLSEVDIMDFVAKQVAPYKKIRRVAFINLIPKSASGKILRRELAKQALHAFVSML